MTGAARTTPWLAGAVVLGFVWIGAFEPALPTTRELERTDSHLLGTPGSEVRRIKLSADQWTYATLERVDGDSFRTVDPTDRVVPGPALLSLLSAIEFCAVHHRLDGANADAAHLHEYGLDQPKLTLAVGLADGTETDVLFGRDGPGGVYAEVRGRDGVAVVDPSLSTAASALLDDIVSGSAGGESDRPKEEP